MIYEDKTGLIRRGMFDVQNEVGLGRKEEVYHQAFHSWLKEQAIPHFSKKAHPLQLGGEVAHVLCPDFIVWDCISIEMKALGLNWGVAINFGKRKLEVNGLFHRT